ncbi:hypothetical protein ARMGADRAFT_1028339 [Armillaria gallica]|uniref:Uncharacterized protein n=1 Tax=Armillaria gallica TaxID=47427 RepID=A0A2H3DQI6_ARMGA|nr:hypothetical protein ARMGADRAFT_1028339 [Armillaria gallica]
MAKRAFLGVTDLMVKTLEGPGIDAFVDMPMDTILSGTLGVFSVRPLGWYYRPSTLPITDLGRFADCALTDHEYALIVAFHGTLTTLYITAESVAQRTCLVRDYEEMCQDLLVRCNEGERSTSDIKFYVALRLPQCPEKLVNLGCGAEFVATPKLKIDRLSDEQRELYRSQRKVVVVCLCLCKTLPPITPFPSTLTFFEIPPIGNIIYLPSNETVTEGHFYRIMEEIILHSGVREPSIEQQVIDCTLRRRSPLLPEEKSSLETTTVHTIGDHQATNGENLDDDMEGSPLSSIQFCGLRDFVKHAMVEHWEGATVLEDCVKLGRAYASMMPSEWMSGLSWS